MRLLSMREQKVYIRYVAGLFDINWCVVSDERDELFDGYSLPEAGLIKITPRKRKLDWLLSLLFHEAAHILAYRNKKYVIFHEFPKTNWTNKELVTYKRNALCAELYVDNFAKKLMKEHFPESCFICAYKTPWDKECLQRMVADVEQLALKNRSQNA